MEYHSAIIFFCVGLLYVSPPRKCKWPSSAVMPRSLEQPVNILADKNRPLGAGLAAVQNQFRQMSAED